MSITTVAPTSRTFTEIASAMIAAFIAQGIDVTDLRVGSAIREILESVAIVAQQADEDRDARLDADIVTSAMRSFGFTTAPAVTASGVVRCFATAPSANTITIPSGTIFSVPGTNLLYTAISDTIMAANATFVDIVVQCQTPGLIGNVPANTITVLSSVVAGILAACTNPNDFVTGRDLEGDAERRVRFSNYLATLHRGTADGIATGVGQAVVLTSNGVVTERVGRVVVSESSGALLIYITNDVIQTSATPITTASATLVTAAQSAVDGTNMQGVITPGFRAAGVTATVIAATTRPRSVNCFVRPASGYLLTTLTGAVQSAIQNYYNALQIGQTLSVSALKQAILGVRGVSSLSLVLPNIDIVPLANEVITLIPFTTITSANPPLSPDETTSWIQGF